MTQTCPTAKDLRGLVDGSLSDIEAQPLELHIDRCEVCQQAIQELAADGTFWKSAAKNLSDDKIVGPGLDRVIETLQHQSREDAEEIGEAIELKLSFIEPPVEPGTIGRLRHYDILRVAGRGGMGIVLKAFDRSLRRVVAIKLLAPHLAGNGQARQRFVREGRAAAAITHEHVVTIHAVEESPPFLVMQYVHGETLEARIHRNGSLDVREAVRIALQIAQGLAAAHAQGVVHRDIKPANILLENGVARVRITDFGLARAIDDASLTQSGVVAGTPQYMAPEQASGDAIDERADLFSLGSVLYTMLAGHAPFRATTAMGVLKRLCDNAARPIREINPETPDWLVVLINRLHAKRPADRFHNAGEVAALLERGLAAMQTGSIPASGWASALRVEAVAENSPPVEDSSAQNISPTPRSPSPRTSQQKSFVFTEFGVPLWLIFAVVGLAVTPIIWEAGVLGGVIATIVLIVPRIFPHSTLKMLNGSGSATAETGKASVNTTGSTHWETFAAIGVLRLCGWLVIFMLPVLSWSLAFPQLEDKALSGMSYQLFAATDEIIGVLVVISVAWLVTAFFWFRQKNMDGSPLFSSVTSRKGILTVVGLTAIFCVCGYGTWHNKVYWPRFLVVARTDPQTAMYFETIPQHFPVRIEFEGPQEGIDVVIENGSPPLTWAPTDGNSRQSTLSGNPGTFPWHATLGQCTFASGEVTLEAGKTAIINMPKPKLIDLIAGRWKSEIKPVVGGMGPSSEHTSSEHTNLEFEFSEQTAIIADRTSSSTSRSDLTVQIDQSVTPALITLTGSSGEKLAGILRFEPHAFNSGLESVSTGMPGMMGMGGGDSMMMGGMGGGASNIPVTDRLLICISQGGSLRPWKFESDPDRGITLFELIRSEDPEPLHRSLVLEPLPVGTTADVVRESAEAWSQRLNVPIERRNSIGMDLTLVSPTHLDVPPEKILVEKNLELSEWIKNVDAASTQGLPLVLGQHSPSQSSSTVSYPFVISRHVVSMAQFQQFVNATGYVTDAERGEPLTKAKSPTVTPIPAESAPAASSDVPIDDAAAIKPASVRMIGGWLRESVLPTANGWHRPDGKFIWHDGLSWKNPTPSAVDGAFFNGPSDNPLPVVMLSYNDATAFCQWLSSKENRQYRLPTADEWTAANQLGAVHLPLDAEHRDPNENRTWFDASQPNPLGIQIATEIAGEWTSGSWRPFGKPITLIVRKDITSDGKRFDLSHQSLAPLAFRSSEISFRVVAELQTLTTPDENQPMQR